MEITLEAVEAVMEQTGVDYKAAKEALLKADGNVDEAISMIQPETKDVGSEINTLIDKLKKLVEEGNVARIRIRKGEETVLNIPVNIGILGGLVGLASAPWALIAGTVAAFGVGCKIEVIRKDGTTDEIIQ